MKFKTNKRHKNIGALLGLSLLSLISFSYSFYTGYQYGKENCINTVTIIEDPKPEPISKEVMRRYQQKQMNSINNTSVVCLSMDDNLICPKEDDVVEDDTIVSSEVINNDLNELNVEDVEFSTTQSNPSEIVIDVNDVSIISNATAEMMEQALVGTKLEGYGQLYYDLEQKYQVNAFISMGNAFQESGWKHKEGSFADVNNNIYGLTGKSFDSLEDCIDYYFRLIHKSYIGKGYISLEQINGKYCPPDDTWDNDIYAIAKKLKNKIDITPN